MVGSVVTACCGVEPGREAAAAFDRAGRWRHATCHYSGVSTSQFIRYKSSGGNIDTAILANIIAPGKAAAREDVQGSGTFLPAPIDEVGNLRSADIGRMWRLRGTDLTPLTRASCSFHRLGYFHW